MLDHTQVSRQTISLARAALSELDVQATAYFG